MIILGVISSLLFIFFTSISFFTDDRISTQNAAITAALFWSAMCICFK